MPLFEQSPFVHAGPARCVARRVAAVSVAAIFIVPAFGCAAHASAAAHDPAASAVSAPGSRISLVSPTTAVNRFLAMAPTVRQRRIALGDLAACVAALAVAYLFCTRASVGAGRRLRFDAVFAFRRGPPTVVAY